MYMHGPDRFDDGNLGNWFTSFRDKIVKPVGRVVAAYYTGGASEIAFKAAEAAKAKKEQEKAMKAQAAELAKMGNTYTPYAYPTLPADQASYNAAQPSMYPQQVPVYPTALQTQVQQFAPQAQAQTQVQAQGYGRAQRSKLPSWAVPAGIGAGVLLLVAATRR